MWTHQLLKLAAKPFANFVVCWEQFQTIFQKISLKKFKLWEQSGHQVWLLVLSDFFFSLWDLESNGISNWTTGDRELSISYKLTSTGSSIQLPRVLNIKNVKSMSLGSPKTLSSFFLILRKTGQKKKSSVKWRPLTLPLFSPTPPLPPPLLLGLTCSAAELMNTNWTALHFKCTPPAWQHCNTLSTKH